MEEKDLAASRERAIEAACRAAVRASSGTRDPDTIVPMPRGQVGVMYLWQSYRRMIEPAIDAYLAAIDPANGG